MATTGRAWAPATRPVGREQSPAFSISSAASVPSDVLLTPKERLNERLVREQVGGKE